MKDLTGINKRIWEFAEPYLDTRNNKQHTLVAIDCAYALMAQEGGEEEVVIPTIILHDTGWIRVPEGDQINAYGPKAHDPETNRIHEMQGAKIALEILSRVDYDKNKIPEIIRIIDGHDSRVEAISLNDRIVKDADKLSRYDRGIMAAFMKMFNIDDMEKVLQDLEGKIGGWFFTDSAKAIALCRIQEART